MKNIIYTFLLMITIFSSCSQPRGKKDVEAQNLKDAFSNEFLIGTAMNVNQIRGNDSLSAEIIKKHFNSIVAEDCMKSMYVQPKEGEFYFGDADKFVEFGEQNNMFIVGHTLVWHSQAPDWFFTDEKGNDVSREVLIERMKDHITTIVSRYKGRIKGWDVVNEAILEDGSFRESKFYKIIGEDFISLAFQFANEADPQAEFYYNDYNEWHKGKYESTIRLVNSLRQKGVRIDAVGFQAHIGLDYPSLEEYKTTLDAYATAGIKVMITEFDISALPSPRKNVGANIADTEEYRSEMNPYINGLPDSTTIIWNKRVTDFFGLFLANSQNIKRITMWGVTDGDSWKNNFPMHGRTDYPLLFDRQYKAKPVVAEIIKLSEDKTSSIKQ